MLNHAVLKVPKSLLIQDMTKTSACTIPGTPFWSYTIDIKALLPKKNIDKAILLWLTKSFDMEISSNDKMMKNHKKIEKMAPDKSK